jgi:tRNA(Ile)-lysidine synthase
MNKADPDSKVLDFIQRNHLIRRRQLIVVGVSGGADSVCLLHVLAGWRKRLGIRLHVAHLDHQIRYAFFARVAGNVGAHRIAIGHTRDDQVETILMHILRGTGIVGLCGLAPCSPLVYDSRRMWSAAGSSGVAKERRSNLLVIRPLLEITREETASYCQKRQLDPRADASNLLPSFFRNRLRLHLLPLLRQYNPSIDQALLRLADIAREDNAFIEQQASEL